VSAPQPGPLSEKPAARLSRVVPVETNAVAAPDSRAPVSPEMARSLCEQLEHGDILYFQRTPFAFSPQDREFLLTQEQSKSRLFKNISYRPAEDRLSGIANSDSAQVNRFRAILRAYSEGAARLLAALLVPYADALRRDLTSYRPFEEHGRAARLHARNDLLHVDAFPTRPVNGSRILRVFTNLNPSQGRVWLTSEIFDALAPRLAKTVGVPRPQSNSAPARALRAMQRVFRSTARSPYDDFMHRCHNALKEDAEFQAKAPKQRLEFPPNSTWIVFTDMVSHAVLSGRFAIEQTFIVPRSAMILPEMSPISILETLCGYPLSNPV
jgi:3-deoxy-D-manno-octulosonic acid hydroxylase-like protein